MSMKSWFLPTAALALCLTGSVLATAGEYYPPAEGSPLYSPRSMITADISGSLGWTKSGSTSVGMAILGARVNVPLHGGWNLEPELGFQAFFDPSITAFLGGGHFYKTLPNAAIGVFAAGEHASSSSFSQNTFTLGGEAAFYGHANSIFGARLGYRWVSTYGNSPFIGGYWDYFFTPDFKGTVAVNWFGGSGSAPSSTAGTVALTKHWAGTPWSAYLSGTIAWSGGNTAETGIVGVVWNYDAPDATLYAHNRSIPFKLTAMPF